MQNTKKAQTVSCAGDIAKEWNEIKNMQTDSGYYVLTISTNTCGEVYTIFCC